MDEKRPKVAGHTQDHPRRGIARGVRGEGELDGTRLKKAAEAVRDGCPETPAHTGSPVSAGEEVGPATPSSNSTVRYAGARGRHLPRRQEHPMLVTTRPNSGVGKYARILTVPLRTVRLAEDRVIE